MFYKALIPFVFVILCLINKEKTKRISIPPVPQIYKSGVAVPGYLCTTSIKYVFWNKNLSWFRGGYGLTFFYMDRVRGWPSPPQICPFMFHWFCLVKCFSKPWFAVLLEQILFCNSCWIAWRAKAQLQLLIELLHTNYIWKSKAPSKLCLIQKSHINFSILKNPVTWF